MGRAVGETVRRQRLDAGNLFGQGYSPAGAEPVAKSLMTGFWLHDRDTVPFWFVVRLHPTDRLGQWRSKPQIKFFCLGPYLSQPVCQTPGVKDRGTSDRDRSGQVVSHAAYYIWKWADNDLPGRPSEVVAELCAGGNPSAIRPFDRSEAIDRLDAVARERRTQFSELFVAAPHRDERATPFIHVSDPSSDSTWLANKLLWTVWALDLTLYDEVHNRLLGLPKQNVVEWPVEEHQFVDVIAGQVPDLLRRLDRHWYLTAMTCYDKQGNMLQVWCHRHRFAVEWQELPDRDFGKHRIRVAGGTGVRDRRVQFGPVSRGLELFGHEVLTMADAHALWVTFLAGNPRPQTYQWREITHELNGPGQVLRYRHVRTEDCPPP